MTITTTVTFDDLIASVERELEDYREQYEEAVALIEDEYGAEMLEADVPDPSEADDTETMQLAGLVMSVMGYEQAGKECQRRVHALETLRDEYGGGEFKIKSLTGGEVMEIETQLRLKADREGVDNAVLNHERKQLVVDAAVADAPEWFPTDEGDPKPSDAENPLMFALYDQAERINNTASTDFTAPGFGDATAASPTEPSATPSTFGPSSAPSAPSDAPTPDSGTDS